MPCGAEVMAALWVAAVTFPPETVLHADVVHGVRVGGVQGLGVVSPSGSVEGSPALDQSMARLGSRMPDQSAAGADGEKPRRDKTMRIVGADHRVRPPATVCRMLNR